MISPRMVDLNEMGVYPIYSRMKVTSHSGELRTLAVGVLLTERRLSELERLRISDNVDEAQRLDSEWDEGDVELAISEIIGGEVEFEVTWFCDSFAGSDLDISIGEPTVPEVY